MTHARAAGRTSLLLLLASCDAALDPPELAAGASAVSLPNLTYGAAEVGKPIAVLKSKDTAGNARGHSRVAMYKGYLLVPYSVDSGAPGGGLSFYDLSDPRHPALVKQVDEAPLREAHGFGFSSSDAGDYAVFQAVEGIELWDLTSITSPVMKHYHHLGGIKPSDYTEGAWWSFFQAPYVFVGGSGHGLYVVDATDVNHPQTIAHLETGVTGGVRIGPVFAVGNLLVASSMDGAGYFTFDISDPAHPQIIQLAIPGPDGTPNPDAPPIYSSMFNGDHIYGAGTDNRLHVTDVSNPSVIHSVGTSEDRLVAGGTTDVLDKGGYVEVQDGFAFSGFSHQFAKVNVSDPAHPHVVLTGSSGIGGRDEDFASVLGNLVFVGSDHPVGSALIPHQAAPDTTPPAVNMVNPRPQAIHQALTSRVGLTFTDAIDVRTIGSASFIVRPLGGAALPGKYSTQTGIVNFSPDAKLQPNTTYEVIVPAGGLRDNVGNAVAVAFTSRFSTGAVVATPLACQVSPTTPTPIGSAATVAVTAVGAGPKTYSFAFGDGSAPTGFAAATSASHTYVGPGHYPVVVTVTNGAETASCTRIQTIHYPLTAHRPTSSVTILYDGGTDFVWVVNPDAGTVTAIDGHTHARRFEAAVGKNPRTLAKAPDGTIWVVNQDAATVSVLSGTTGANVATLALPPRARPYGIAFAPDGGAAYVTLQGTGTLLKLSPTTRQIVAELALGAPVRGVAISADSARVLVTRFLSPDARGEVLDVSAAPFALVRTVPLALDPGPDTEASGRGVPNYLTSIAISPDGRRAWVPSEKDNLQRGLARDGLPLTFESAVRTITSQIDLGANAEVQADRKDYNDRDMAQAVTFSELGDYAVVSMQGTGEIELVDAYTSALAGGIAGDGLAPQGAAFSADFHELFVNDFLSRTVTVHDVSGLLDGSTTAAPTLATVTTVATEPLAPAVLRGKQIFYNANDRRMNRDGYIACASCHLDGDSDGRVWDFTDQGEGLRNTIALTGRGGMRQGFVHWSANFDEIQDFEHPIRSFFGGTGFMSDAAFGSGTRDQTLGDPKAGVSSDLDALAAFVGSLADVSASPFRNPDGTLTAAAQTGKALFAQLGCATCHQGAEFSDSAAANLHDVGTLRPTSGSRLGGPLTGIDTPTLKGIWETAPYLHDGSASTLLDVLTTRNPAGLHGATLGLAAAQREALVAYLQQIDELEAPRVTLGNLAVKDTSNAGDWSIQSGLAVSGSVFGDRSFVFASVPLALQGATYLRAANDSKAYSGNPVVTFSIDQSASVYLTVDTRAAKPGWIDATWTDTGLVVGIRENASTVRSMKVYRKTFAAGTVALGPWMNTGIDMYDVIVK
jgi:PKD repeat protein